jgi:cytokinesis protein
MSLDQRRGSPNGYTGNGPCQGPHPGETGHFGAWMRLVELTFDNRRKMSSLVRANKGDRRIGMGMDILLIEYWVSTMLLINMLVDAAEDVVEL